ncbi:MAG: BTAD domain-containing putative transcriptional regulator, partial [Bacillota bacterium]
CDYNDALDWYNLGRKYLKQKNDSKGISVAHQKTAMIYLDTVQPTKADKYLKKALELREKETYWEESVLLRLVAENYLNRGNVKKAKEMQKKLEELDQENTNQILNSRVKIRTGRLKEAEKILLEELNNNNKSNKNVGRAHRETILLLSLIAALEGNSTDAINYAKLGLEKSKKLESLFTKAVSHMRRGHALQINSKNNQNEAIDAYEKSLRIVDKLQVRRGRAEALWGLTLVYGNLGYKEQMKKYGYEGLKICEEAGDEWLGSLIQLSLGIGYIFLGEHKNATEWLTKAVKSFDYCNDIFGKTVGQIWLTLIECRENRKVEFKHRLEEIVPVIRENNFQFIFKTINLLGPRDKATLLPILTKGYNMDIKKEFCKLLLEDMDIEVGINHPGYTLRIETLGRFRLFRGRITVNDTDWKRKKARKLFKIFITNQNELISKERLAEMISPKKDQKSAIRDFKVALNTLNNVIEPDREKRATPYFINKHNSRYGLNPKATIEIDKNKFEDLIKKGLKNAKLNKTDQAINNLSDATSLYKGDYLPNCVYQDWSREVRERYKQLFIQGAEVLAELHYKKSNYQKAIETAEKIIAEETTVEKSYQIIMKSYNMMGERSQALKSYQRCVVNLDKELSVVPTKKTNKIHQEIKDK